MSGDKITAVLYYKSDAEQFLIDKLEVNQIYPLTPDAYAIIKDKTILPILDPIKIFSNYSHRKVIARVRSVEKRILPLLYKEKKLSMASKETFRGCFHVILCSVFQIWYSLKPNSTWLVYTNGSWYKSNNKYEVHKLLVNKIYDSRTGIYGFAPNQKIFYINKIKWINKFLLKTISGKKCIWTTGSEYGLSNLKRQIHDKYSDLYILNPKLPQPHSIINSFVSMINLLLGKKNIDITLLPQINNDYSKLVYKLLDDSADNIINSTKNIIDDIIIDSINYTQSIIKYTTDLFYKTQPIVLIAHETRWLNSAVLAETAKKNNVKVKLMSHGSHTFGSEKVNIFEQKENARGLLFSPLADETFIQSPIAEISAKRFMPELKRKRLQPIMWGGVSKLGNLNKKIKFIILHASSYKPIVAPRPWIYETSNEFVFGLQQFVNAVKKIDNVELIIRIRSTLECDVSSLDKLLPVSDNCRIKSDGSFQDDLNAADLLVSFSSTTIEEALYARKPVALFGGSDRYRHLPGSNTYPDTSKRSAVYHLTKYNMAKMIPAIATAHFNKPLTDNEVSDYVWPDSVPGIDTFVSNLLK